MLLFRKNDYNNIGIILKTHGIGGELIIKSDDYVISEILENSKFLIIEIDGLLVPYHIEYYEEYDEDVALVKLEDIDDETLARQFLQKRIYIDKNVSLSENTLKKQGNFLKDYQFFDNNTKIEGKVLRFINIPENPLIELSFNNRTVLCPYNSDIVIEVNHDKRFIVLKTPEGLFNI